MQMNTNTSLFANKKLIFIIAGVAVALIIGAGLLASGSRDPVQDNLQRATLRYGSTVKLTSDARKEIHNADLNKINSEANLLLNSDSVTITGILTQAYGSKISKEMIASEVDTSSAAKLKEASLLARYDTVYAEVLARKIESIDSLFIEIFGQIKNTRSLQGIKTAQNHTSTLLEQLRALKI
jgi:hypothetical protein